MRPGKDSDSTMVGSEGGFRRPRSGLIDDGEAVRTESGDTHGIAIMPGLS